MKRKKLSISEYLQRNQAYLQPVKLMVLNKNQRSIKLKNENR